MMRTKNILLIILLVFILTNLVYSQKKNNSKDGIYQKEMKSLRSAIQKNLYDKASGNYILITDTSKRERKDVTIANTLSYGRYALCSRLLMKL